MARFPVDQQLPRAEWAEVVRELFATIDTGGVPEKVRLAALHAAVRAGVASLDADKGIRLPDGDLRSYLRARVRLATERAGAGEARSWRPRMGAMSMRASGAIIVGAGPRLGAAIAGALAAAGRPIGLIGHSTAGVAQVRDMLRGEGIQAHSGVADVSDAAALAATIHTLGDALGGIDVAVHNVSTWRDAGATMTAADLLSDVAIGTASLLTITNAVAPAMIERSHGTILATGSAAADHPTPGAPSLAVQKAGLRVLVRGLAAELVDHGVHAATVTINGVLGEPGFDVADIAPLYADLAAETDGPANRWRTVVEFNGAR